MKLKELCNVTSSKRIFASQYQNSGIPFYRGKEISLLSNNEKIEQELYISEALYQEINKKYGVPKKDDILMTAVGTIGNCYIVKDEKIYFKDGNIIWLKDIDSKKILPKYLYYYLNLNSTKNTIDSLLIGSTQKALTIESFKNVEIDVPNIEIQSKIVKLLNILSNKIRLNTDVNNNLYEIGKTLFENLFELENFENKNLNDVCDEITRGYTKNYVEKSNIINLNQKVNKGKTLEKQYFKYLDEKQEIPVNRFVKKNDILLNSLGQGTLGRVHLFLENTDNVVVDQHITIIRTDNNIINPYYLYYLLVSKKYQDKLVELVTGTTGMQMLNISAIRELKIPIPMKKNSDNFEKNVKLIFEKININNLENENLIKLQDTLLPKLMNGEVNIDNVEI